MTEAATLRPTPTDDGAPRARRANRNARRGGPRGPRVDDAPPRFDPMLLRELAGPPVYQAVHDAVVKDVTDVAVFVEVTAGGETIRAAVPSAELTSAPPSPGDALRVRLLDPKGSAESVPAASVRQAEALDLLSRVLEQQARGEPVEGEIAAEVKGGFAVAVGETRTGAALRAFLPRSQGIHPKVHGDRSPVGEKDSFDLMEVDAERLNLVLSRKGRLDAAYEAGVKERFDALKVGDIVEGTVRAVVAFGAFVDVGGVDALLHMSDLSWDRAPRVASVLRVGDRLKAKVLVCDPGERRLKIGLKQLIPNPWEDLKGTLVKDAVVEGDVVSLQEYGAFVRIADGVEGLVHVSEAGWERLKHVSQKLHIGDRVKAKVLDVDVGNRRVSLSIRALEKNPFEVVRDKYPPGTVLKVRVKSLSDFGAFVAIDDHVDGLVHVGEISWVDHVNHPSEVLNIGQEIEVVVLDVDVSRQRVSCSMKQLTPNPWKAWEDKYARGTRHTLKVTRVDNYGITFALPEAELSASCGSRDVSGEGARPGEVAKNGDELEVEVKSFDRKNKRVVVSLRAVLEGDVRAAYDEYKRKEQADQRMTLGDALKGKLAGAKAGDKDSES